MTSACRATASSGRDGSRPRCGPRGPDRGSRATLAQRRRVRVLGSSLANVISPRSSRGERSRHERSDERRTKRARLAVKRAEPIGFDRPVHPRWAAQPTRWARLGRGGSSHSRDAGGARPDRGALPRALRAIRPQLRTATAVLDPSTDSLRMLEGALERAATFEPIDAFPTNPLFAVAGSPPPREGEEVVRMRRTLWFAPANIHRLPAPMPRRSFGRVSSMRQEPTAEFDDVSLREVMRRQRGRYARQPHRLDAWREPSATRFC